MGEIKIEVYQDGWTNGLQVCICDHNGGYRIAGPKFNGSGKLLLSKTLNERDIQEIQSYLKASKQDVEADAKIKDAIMQIYEGNEVKGLDILCLLVGWIPNGKASQPDVETERINSKTT